jgi:hypothetical protein
MTKFNTTFQHGSETPSQEPPITPLEQGGTIVPFPEQLKTNTPEILELFASHSHMVEQGGNEIEKNVARNPLYEAPDVLAA